MHQQHTEFTSAVACVGSWRSRAVATTSGSAARPARRLTPTQQVQAKVQRYFAQGRGTYGTRRIKHLLAQEGLRVSRRRIGRLLAQAGLARQNTAEVQSAYGCRPGPDGGTEPAQPGVYGAGTR